MFEGEGRAVQSVVEADHRAVHRFAGPADQPLLQLRMATGAGLRERVEHPRGPVRQPQPTDAELLDVSREEPVVPVGCGAGEDGPGQLLAGSGPAVGVEPVLIGRLVGRCRPARGRDVGGGRREPGPRDRCRFPPGFVRWRDHVDRLGQELRRYGEVLGDDRRQMAHLGPREPQQLGHRQEQRQAQAGERVVVDRDAGGARRGREPLVTQARPDVLLDQGGHLEVQQRDGVVRTDHDVEQVQIPVDDAAFVHGEQGGLDLLVHAQRPVGVGREVGRRGADVDHRVLAHEGPVQRYSVDELHHHEAVLAQREAVVHRGDPRDSGEALQRLVFTVQASDRVGTVGVQSGVRTALLEHDVLSGRGAPAAVAAATVGEVHHLVDGVLQLGYGDGVAGGQMRREEVRQLQPGRQGEDRVTAVGHERAGVVGDG